MWLWANDITTVWGGVPNVLLTLSKTHFANFEQFKVDIYFTNFWLDTHCFFLLLWQGHSYFNEFGWDMPWKTIQTLCLIKIQQPCIGSGTPYFQWSNQQESRTGFASQ